MTAGEQLRQWLESGGRKQTWLAVQCKVDHSTLHRWLVGEATPHPLAQAELERLTGIPASAWVRG